MQRQITQRHLSFMEESKKFFGLNVRAETNINKEGDLIALRMGADRDCIQIFDLGDEVGFFAQMISYKSKTPGIAAYDYGR